MKHVCDRLHSNLDFILLISRAAAQALRWLNLHPGKQKTDKTNTTADLQRPQNTPQDLYGSRPLPPSKKFGGFSLIHLGTTQRKERKSLL